jgi:hypothetical protein
MKINTIILLMPLYRMWFVSLSWAPKLSPDIPELVHLQCILLFTAKEVKFNFTYILCILVCPEDSYKK